MLATLLHPGDLGLLGILEFLLLIVGVPALVIFVLALAVYKGVSVKKGSFNSIRSEGELGPDGKGAGRANRP